MKFGKVNSPDWSEVFSYLSRLRVDVEDGRELIVWLDKMVEVFGKAKVEGRISEEVYAHLLKFVLCFLLVREGSNSDRAYMLGAWHPSHLLRVLLSGFGLKGVNEVLEVLERGLKRIYEEQGEEVFERVVGVMFGEVFRQLGKVYKLGVN